MRDWWHRGNESLYPTYCNIAEHLTLKHTEASFCNLNNHYYSVISRIFNCLASLHFCKKKQFFLFSNLFRTKWTEKKKEKRSLLLKQQRQHRIQGSSPGKSAILLWSVLEYWGSLDTLCSISVRFGVYQSYYCFHHFHSNFGLFRLVSTDDKPWCQRGNIFHSLHNLSLDKLLGGFNCRVQLLFQFFCFFCERFCFYNFFSFFSLSFHLFFFLFLSFIPFSIPFSVVIVLSSTTPRFVVAQWFSARFHSLVKSLSVLVYNATNSASWLLEEVCFRLLYYHLFNKLILLFCVLWFAIILFCSLVLFSAGLGGICVIQNTICKYEN